MDRQNDIDLAELPVGCDAIPKSKVLLDVGDDG